MRWKTNARYDKADSDGSIFKSGIVSIHRLSGVKGTWFLTCHKLNIIQHNLQTNDFEVAVMESKEAIRAEFNKLKEEVDSFLMDDTPTTFYRY